MLRKWVVAQRIHCIGGPTGFMPDDYPRRAYWTKRGATASIGRVKRDLKRTSRLHFGDELHVRPLEERDIPVIKMEERIALVIPSTEGYRTPIHPDSRESYEEAVRRISRKARSRIIPRTMYWK